MLSKIWDDNTYLFPNFNAATGNRVLISSQTLWWIWLLPYWDQCWIMLVKGAPEGHWFMKTLFVTPNDPYTRQWTRPSLVQIMACRLIDAKPLSWSMRALTNNFMDIWSKIPQFTFKKIYRNVVCTMEFILVRPLCVKVCAFVPTFF